MKKGWDKQSLLARIEKSGERKRFAAGSPNGEEVAAYESALRQCTPHQSALVLGMTPELRSLAARLFSVTYAVDNNPESIALYSDWLAHSEREKEEIISEDWMALSDRIGTPLSAILGDGVFGNLSNLGLHTRLLKIIRSLLSAEGVFVTRKILIPEGFDPAVETFESKLAAFRNGDIDDAEFGFFSRILGFYESCYSPGSHILDNGKLFRQVADMHARGQLTDEEHRVINRYYFPGENSVVPERTWEELLENSGFTFQVFPCSGKDWYRYYRIYQCRPRP